MKRKVGKQETGFRSQESGDSKEEEEEEEEKRTKNKEQRNNVTVHAVFSARSS